MGPPADIEAMKCTKLENIIDMTCTLDGRIIEIIFNEHEKNTDVFRWSLSNIQNAASTKPSIMNVYVLDSEGFIVSARPTPPTIINDTPATLEVYSIE